MPFSDKEVALILERLRAGESVTHSHSGGRYVTTWSFENGEWLVDEFEEGSSFKRTISDEEMRATVVNGPESLWLKMLGR